MLVPAGQVDKLAGQIRGLRPSAGSSVIVAIDGRSGAGKTTLANELASRHACNVIHMDDIYPGWNGLAAATEILADDVLRPIAEHRPAGHRRWNWDADRPDGWADVPTAPIMIVEGCGSGSRKCAPFLSLVVWVDAPRDVRKARGIARDGETFRPHWERWARQEDALFAVERTHDRADIHINGISLT
jgi:uridine kinase